MQAADFAGLAPREPAAPEPLSVLVVDDDAGLGALLCTALAGHGYDARAETSPMAALHRLRTEPVDIVITDYQFPELSGIELIRQAMSAVPELIIILMSGVATVREAVASLELGAYDFFSKPFRVHELAGVLRRAVERRQLQREVQALRERLGQRYTFAGIIGESGALQEVLALLAKVVRSDATVLVQGESGTGKELIAEVIHRHGARKDGPLVKVNCAAIPEGLLESELFGHERGAFTGAVRRQPGKFEQALGGTIFLDEVGDMAPATQAKILRVLEDHTLFRVGGTQPVRVDARVVAATNRDLTAAVSAKAFRADLYHRLNVFPIVLPPLRERPDDIPLLVEHFLTELGGGRQAQRARITADALEALMAYSWPGNVRELSNCVQRALIMSEGDIIAVDHLPPTFRLPPEERPPGSLRDLDGRLAAMERQEILDALRQTGGVQAEAARLLGIAERSLWYRVRKYDVDCAPFRRGTAGS